jgi:hypothetical protein
MHVILQNESFFVFNKRSVAVSSRPSSPGRRNSKRSRKLSANCAELRDNRSISSCQSRPHSPECAVGQGLSTSLCLALIFSLQPKNGVQNMYRNERVSRSVYNSSLSRNSLFMRHDGRREYAVRLQDISEALIADGYTSLNAQAKALGLHRSAAWTIMKAKHKLGRLTACCVPAATAGCTSAPLSEHWRGPRSVDARYSLQLPVLAHSWQYLGHIT